MNRWCDGTKAMVFVLAILTALLATLTGHVKSSNAWTAPTLDGKLDDVYRQYGALTRYGDTNTHTPTGLDDYAAAYLYVLEDANYIYVFYHQDKYYSNDNSYGENSIHWESRKNGKRNLFDIWESDMGEFAFKDAGGNVVAHFYTDQIEPSAGTPSGYDCLGFSGGDGLWLDGPVANQAYIEITSGMDYNLNVTGYCSGGSCGCGTGATQVDLLADSPYASGSYETTDSGCDDWQWDNSWEIRVDKQAFGSLGYGVVLGNHHNSPTKTCEKKTDCAPDLYLAKGSIGDRVWYDLDGDGVQDSGEPGLQGVTVNLVDPRDGGIIESQLTGGQGEYLFEMLSNMYYIIQVDETTLPSGFASTTGLASPVDFSESYVNNVCGSDCIQRDGDTYTRIYYIDLDYDEHYRTADFGYRPDGAAIGDYVWADADNDGLQDLGEPGISGVLLELLDENGDPLGTTTTTSGAGWYVFGGLDAGTYRVRVADSNFDPGGPLEGYTHSPGFESSPSPTADIVLAEDEIYIHADFGYYKDGLGSIGDYVWFDVDNEGDQDAGEDGVADVTLVLYLDTNQDGALDPGEPAMGNTITAADGSYTFVGLELDEYYLVTVSDGNGVLDGYTITTYWGDDPGDPLDLDRYNDPCPVHLTDAEPDVTWVDFGYNRPGSIGDTVWFDWDQDGVKDSGEIGVGGATLSLSGDATDFHDSDPDGTYLFTEQDSGTYNVTLTIPAGYSLSAGTPNNPHGPISITGNQSYLDADFGLWRSDAYTIGNVVWLDHDGDGYRDATEAVIGDVTLALYEDRDSDQVLDPTEPLLGTTTTDMDGLYTFYGATDGCYIVVVTDDNDVLEGFLWTDGVDDTDDYSQVTTYPVTVSGGNVNYADFGFKHLLTLAVISSFEAYEQSGQVVLEWETSSEVGTVGFYLRRLNEETGKFKDVNKKLLPGLLNAPGGGIYRYVDDKAEPGETYTYELVEVEASGKKLRHGPFTVTVGQGGSELSSTPVSGTYTRQTRKKSSAETARNEARKSARKAAKALKKARKGQAAKVAVKEQGFYYLDAAEIAGVLDVPMKTAELWIDKTELSLRNQGKEVAWLEADGNRGIYFFGEGMESNYTDENIYWLEVAKGKKMAATGGKGPGPADDGGIFTETIHLEQDLWAIPNLFHDPESDFFLWDYVFAGYPGLGSKTYALEAEGAASTSELAALTVRLKGGADTDAKPDHHVTVRMNGYEIGEGRWEGTGALSLRMEFSQEYLNNGDNIIEIVGLLDAGVPYSIFYVDSFDLTYQRYYRAVDNKLLATGDGKKTLTIRGFTDSDIYVFDVTKPRKPKLIEATTVKKTDGAYGVSFKPVTPEGRYLALTLDASSTPVSMTADVPSQLRQGKNSADYLVVTPFVLKDAAQSLADYRYEFETMVVDLEDIYDEFNGGISSPKAIREFLSYAFHEWQKAPRYVVLAGDGSYDYKDIQGSGDNLVPPLMVATLDGLFPSDNRFVDIVGNDGVPEMAIGRLPAGNSEELLALVDKVMIYENGSGDWTNRIMMLADAPDDGTDFATDSDDVAFLLPSEYTVDKVYLSQHAIGSARELVLNGFNDGALIVNYIGHGGVDRLAQKGMLLISDVASLQNSERFPIVTAMTCIIGQYAIPGFTSLSEALMLKNDGGAVAVWSPTGLSANNLAKILDGEFFRAIFIEGEKRLGQSVRRALKAYSEQGGEPLMLDIYTLLGDPATQVH